MRGPSLPVDKAAEGAGPGLGGGGQLVHGRGVVFFALAALREQQQGRIKQEFVHAGEEKGG